MSKRSYVIEKKQPVAIRFRSSAPGNKIHTICVIIISENPQNLFIRFSDDNANIRLSKKNVISISPQHDACPQHDVIYYYLKKRRWNHE